MKKTYEFPELEMKAFQSADVVTSSPEYEDMTGVDPWE